jgi:hypothetical protein
MEMEILRATARLLLQQPHHHPRLKAIQLSQINCRLNYNGYSILHDPDLNLFAIMEQLPSFSMIYHNDSGDGYSISHEPHSNPLDNTTIYPPSPALIVWWGSMVNPAGTPDFGAIVLPVPIPDGRIDRQAERPL